MVNRAGVPTNTTASSTRPGTGLQVLLTSSHARPIPILSLSGQESGSKSFWGLPAKNALHDTFVPSASTSTS